MELAERIRARRSVQVFQERDVSPALVEELLEAAVWAPNHHLTEPWRFILVSGEGRRHLAEASARAAEARYAALEPEARAVRAAQARASVMAVPLFVVVVLREHWRLETREEDLLATGCLLQNFLLLASERGLGTAVKTPAWMHEELLRQRLQLGAGERVVLLVQVGYPARLPASRPRTPARERLRWVTEG